VLSSFLDNQPPHVFCPSAGFALVVRFNQFERIW
jgi:hypothetical protein